MRDKSHDLLPGVKTRVLEALGRRRNLADRVQSYAIDVRTKGLVSTFRKVRNVLGTARRGLCLVVIFFCHLCLRLLLLMLSAPTGIPSRPPKEGEATGEAECCLFEATSRPF